MAAAGEGTPLLAPRAARASMGDVAFATLPLLVPAGARARAWVVLSGALQLCDAALGVVPGLVLKRVVDAVAATASADAGAADARVPYALVWAYFAAVVAQRVLARGAGAVRGVVVGRVKRDVHVGLFGCLFGLGVGYHLRKRAGEVSEVMRRGAHAVVSLAETLCFELAPVVLDSVAVCVVFWHLGSLSVAGVTLVSALVYCVASVWQSALQWRFVRRGMRLSMKMWHIQWMCLGNYETTAAFGRVDEEVHGYERLHDRSQAVNAENSFAMGPRTFGRNTLRAVGTTAGLLLAAYATVYASPRLTPGDFFLIKSYIERLFGPLGRVARMYEDVGSDLVNLEKVAAILRRRPDIVDADGAVDLVQVREERGLPGEIVFENVSFKYKSPEKEPAFARSKWKPRREEAASSDDDAGESESDDEASWGKGERGSEGGVENVSFRVEAGKTVAVVGTTGAGKSTIMRLLLRFYDVDAGAVSLDGHDIRAVTQASLRSVIGYVSQEVSLFNETLRFNIGYGAAEASSDVHLMHAADVASLGDFIRKQELGLAFRPGRRGGRMSGGEQQRAGSARVIATTPSVLLLDEATSALDSITERQLQRAVRAWCRGKTTLIIAHRLSTIAHAHQIIVLEKGTVVERGSHEELLKAKGTYAEMWTLQTSAPDSLPDDTDK